MDVKLLNLDLPIGKHIHNFISVFKERFLFVRAKVEIVFTLTKEFKEKKK